MKSMYECKNGEIKVISANNNSMVYDDKKYIAKVSGGNVYEFKGQAFGSYAAVKVVNISKTSVTLDVIYTGFIMNNPPSGRYTDKCKKLDF